MSELIKLPPENEVIISTVNHLHCASQEDKNNALSLLFIGLTDAITKHGCCVDISDPLNIKISK